MFVIRLLCRALVELEWRTGHWLCSPPEWTAHVGRSWNPFAEEPLNLYKPVVARRPADHAIQGRAGRRQLRDPAQPAGSRVGPVVRIVARALATTPGRT